MEVRVYTQLAELPLFNPDLDGDEPPTAVAQFRLELDASAAVLISSPEYAHGVPGALKNALDWIVGSGEIVGKPVALFNASPRATHAQASLAETLRVMSANLVEDASIAVPLSGRHLDASGIVADMELSSVIRSALAALAQAANGRVAVRSLTDRRSPRSRPSVSDPALWQTSKLEGAWFPFAISSKVI